jgi:sec-independent protein translocase protein TatB
MNLFGIGTSEFIIIFILALIFLGPQRLPQYANKLGQKIREWRMMSQVFMVEWKEELAALEEARQSLEEARSALREAQETVSTEVSEVTQTVSTEMESAQKDISEQLSGAEKAVSDETAQIRDTIEKAKKGEVDIVAAEAGDETVYTPAVKRTETDLVEATEDTVPADTDVSVADVDDVSDVSDVTEFDEDDVSDVVENTIAPPTITAKAKQAQTSQATELDEIDVAEVQTVSDVASEVAEKIATEVATQVARKVTKNMTTDMAEEVAALVMTKLAETGINGNVVADAQESLESTELQEVVNE